VPTRTPERELARLEAALQGALGTCRWNTSAEDTGFRAAAAGPRGDSAPLARWHRCVAPHSGCHRHRPQL